MRRFSRSHIAIGRSISNFNFGQKPLSEEFGSFVPKRVEAVDRGVKTTQLANGVRVITHDLEEPTSAFGFYFKAGAKYDPITKPGLNYVFRWAFLSSNMDNSLFQMDRTLRSIGASYEHQELRKELLGFKVEVRRDQWKAPFEKMLSNISVPRFPDVEIDRYRDTMDAVLEELRWQSPREYCVEQLEQVAFFKEPLGQPRYVPAVANDDITSAVLLEQWAKLFIPKRMVIVGVNVDHDELLATYENAPFPHDVSAPHFRAQNGKQPVIEREESMYSPGRERELVEKRYKEMSTKPYLDNETIVALGFRGFGADSVHDYATSLVAQQLLDVALEDGLRVQTLETEHGVRSFMSGFSKVGLWGVTVRETPSRATDAVMGAHKIIKGLGASVNKDTLALAKRRALVRFFHDHIELRRDYADFLATSFVSDGLSRLAQKDYMKALTDVSESDVKKFLEASLSVAPCMFSTGEVSQMPSMKQMGFVSQ